MKGEADGMRMWVQGEITVSAIEVQAVRMWLRFVLQVARDSGDAFAIAFFTRASTDTEDNIAMTIGTGKVEAVKAGEQPMCIQAMPIH